MRPDLPQDLADEERLAIEVIDEVASRFLTGASAEADETGHFDPSMLAVLRHQGLVTVEPRDDQDDPMARLDLLVVERLARVAAATATLVAGHADCTAAC
ncbi:MAG: hypothetical protein QOI18_1648, partial [Solirubrobacteraceae bacterium]|nr:hypothetical protein [Solirubrobacteraceae bacterium]